MKLKTLFLLSLFISLRSYSQNRLDLKGIWVPVETKSISGVKMEYDLGYSRLEFSRWGDSPDSRDSVLRAYEYFFIGGDMRYTELKYEIKDSTLRIQNSFFTNEFRITSLTDTQLYMTSRSGEKKYLFNKIKSAKVIFDYNKYQRYTRPVFKGNLRASIDKALLPFPANDTSTSYQVSLKIDKKGAVDSITIKNMAIDDPLYKAIEGVLLTTAKKWKPGTVNDKNKGMTLDLDVYRMSAFARDLKAKNCKELIKAMFEMGTRYQQFNENRKALICYKECVDLYNYVVSMEAYSPVLEFEAMPFMNKTSIAAVMNSALIYFNAGDVKEACNRWRTVLNKDTEALQLYNKYYKTVN